LVEQRLCGSWKIHAPESISLSCRLSVVATNTRTG
jgi:hypothetical protein